MKIKIHIFTFIEKFNIMNILITGAGGFIGSFMVEKSLNSGYNTWAGVRKTTSREFLCDERINFIDFNYANNEILTEQLKEVKNIVKWDIIDRKSVV